jgi:hypothetical protein
MTALLSPAVGGSMKSQMEAKFVSMNLKSPELKSNMPCSPSACTFTTSVTKRHSLAFDSSSSFLSPDSAVGNPSDAAATLAQQCAKLKAVSNPAHRKSAPALATSGERGTGPASVHSAKSRSEITPLLRIYPSSIGRFTHWHRAPTSLASPIALYSALPAPMVPPSTHYLPLWATAGRAW